MSTAELAVSNTTAPAKVTKQGGKAKAPAAPKPATATGKRAAAKVDPSGPAPKKAKTSGKAATSDESATVATDDAVTGATGSSTETTTSSDTGRKKAQIVADPDLERRMKDALS